MSLGVGLLAILFVASESHAATCESLRTLSLPDTTITLAQSVAAGAVTSPDAGRPGAPPTADFKQLPAFCRVGATLKPSTDSDIRIEVWLPLSNWNGKFQGVGNGGLAGFIIYTSGRGGIERGLAEALARGYATASTDTGHTGGTAAAFLGHPEKLLDFADRAVHEMTVTAKAIVHAFYDARPKLSYWNSCSSGGRQGLIDSASCLTAAQVETAQTLTNTPRHPKTDETIYPGLAWGTELGWGLRIGGPTPQFYGPEYFKYVFYKDRNWDWRTFDLEAAVAISDGTDYRILNATDPDLKRFQQRGGKLLLYHGWSDAHFSAQFTIDFYERMRAAVGPERIEEWARLFLAPGMGHCGGAQGAVGRTGPRAGIDHRYTRY